MKKLISIFLAFAIFFSLSYVLSENFSETSLATLNNPTSLFVYDLNKDGKDEILVTSIDGKLHVFDKSGTEKWNYPTNEIPYSVIVEDIDGDNLAEIIIGTGKIDPQSFRYSSGKIIILNHFGKQKWSYTTTSAIKGIYISDIDSDSKKEILASAEDGMLYVLNNNGTLNWSKFTGSRSPAFSANVTGSANTLIHGSAILNNKGKIIATAPGFFEWKKYIIRDLNKDGKIEFIMLSQYPFITTFNLEGAELKGIWQFQCDGDVMDVIVDDLNGDGTLEIIATSSKWINSSNTYDQGKIYILNGNDGKLIESISLTSPAFYLGVSDVNNDGKKDIIYTSDKGINALLSGGKATQEIPKEQTGPTPQETTTKNTPGFEVGAVSAAALLVGYYLKRRK
ncbi:MAG TPA: VCBS repeat-containing protein [Methanofastidiosum sp.]|nr:VCBS repeat-containing protein [Methanofastidiosum sp.]